jgi:hypothetical protein
MSDNKIEFDHEKRISVLENQSENFISLTNESFKEIKTDIKNIKTRLNDLGNGGFREIIIETNQKLLQELLERDDKEREFSLLKKKGKWQYIIEKNKVIFGFFGGAAGLKLIEFLSKIIERALQ